MLRALLTNEFLGMPARLDRIKHDVAELKTRVTQDQGDECWRTTERRRPRRRLLLYRER